MQKKIIALAVGGLFAGAAFAQSNVTIYGIVDAYFASASTTNAVAGNPKSHVGVDSGGLGGSRIGFKGTEDLGGGLKANFVLEYALWNDVNAGIGVNGATFTAREQTVGLSGGFGTVVAGRMPTLTYHHNLRYNALAGTALDPAAQVRGATGTGWDHLNRVNNAIAYLSPNMSGFTVGVAQVFVGENKTVAGNGRQSAQELDLNYAAGPFGVGLTYQKVGNTSGLGLNDGSKQYTLGASYDAKVVKVTLNHTIYDLNAANTDKGKGWSLGVVAPVGAGAVHFAYANSKGTAQNVDDGAKSWALAYTYGLSKRTTAYAGYGQTNAKSGAGGAFYGLATEADKKAKVFAVGLQHKF